MMNVTKYLDSSSPNICKALWSAKVMDSVVLTCCRMDNDAAIKFLEITMGERGGGLLTTCVAAGICRMRRSR